MTASAYQPPVTACCPVDIVFRKNTVLKLTHVLCSMGWLRTGKKDVFTCTKSAIRVRCSCYKSAMFNSSTELVLLVKSFGRSTAHHLKGPCS